MNNIIVLDLSKPRKMVVNKFDEIIFDYKIKKYKQLSIIDKLLIITGIGIAMSILIPQTTVYAKEFASELSNTEVTRLFKEHMQKLYYSNEFIDRLLKTYDVNEMRDILDESMKLQDTMKESTPLLSFLELEYKGLQTIDKCFVNGIEKLAYIVSDINPFVDIFKSLK